MFGRRPGPGARDEYTATPPLSGAGVRLEPLTAGYRDQLAEAVRDGELWRTWYTRIPPPEGMAAEIDRRLSLQRAGIMAPWVIVVPGDRDSGTTDRVVGMTTFMNVDPDNRRLEIGSTWLRRSAQGTGVNAEAKLLLLTRAFEKLDCVAVEFRTHWHNHRSRAAIARLGAKQDGVLRNHQFWPPTGPDGAPTDPPVLRDTVVFSIIDAEWPTVRLGLQERVIGRR